MLGTDGATKGKVASGALGNFVCRYTYDGLGRLAWKETPVTVGLTPVQRKDYYYDGVRRIQEVITRPKDVVIDEPPPPEMGDTEAIAESDELLVVPRSGSLPVVEDEPVLIPDPNDFDVWIDREYVYGPGYVDEFAFSDP